MSNPNGNPGNFKPLTSEEARIRGAKGGSSPKRKATLDSKRIMNKLLLSKPLMSEELKAQLRRIGINTDDEELQTNAALLSASIMQKAIQGDLDAIKTAFEMAGMTITARDQTERQRLKIEEKKLRLMERGQYQQAEMPVLIDTRPPEPEAEPKADTEPPNNESGEIP